MEFDIPNNLISLDPNIPIWDRVYTVAPLVVIGSKGNGEDDLAPKHMATPIGFGNYFGFVCTPRHCTYENIKKTGVFSVSFPTPEQLVSISLSATPRKGSVSKSATVLAALPTVKASSIDVLMIEGAYLYLECELFKIIDGFDDYSLITGHVRHVLVHEHYLRSSDQDDDQQIREHPLLAYIAHGRFATIRDTYNFPFPKDFQR
jgi:flavin reductase (DIM6/NTAB) family NADH-FMN oxidoreductase RutF